MSPSFLDALIISPVPQIIRVGIHVLCLVIQSCPTLCDLMDSSPPDSSVHGDSLGKNTGVAYHALLQGISPTQGLKPGLPHCRQILYCLNYQGNPKILEWGAYLFSKGSSQPRNKTRVSCIAGGFFTAEPLGKLITVG